MNIVNVTGVEHESNLDLTGIPAGNYQVLVNGEVAGSFIAGEGTTTVALSLPAGDSAKVEIKAGAAAHGERRRKRRGFFADAYG